MNITTTLLQRLAVHTADGNERSCRHFTRTFAATIALAASLTLTAPPIFAQGCPSSTELHKLISSDGATRGFGIAVSLDGNRALVGTLYSATPTAFVFDTISGTQLIELTPADDLRGYLNLGYGRSVSLDGNLAIVGAFRSGENSEGAAYVFDVTTGEQLFKLTASDRTAYAQFGLDVALDGDRAIIGARRGTAYVFDLTTGTELFKFTPDSNYSPVGSEVALEGEYAIVGARFGGHAPFGGAIVIDSNNGEELFRLTSSADSPHDNFGHAIAISGNHVVVGANRADAASGTVYVFDVTTGRELFRLKAPNIIDYAGFGYSVDLDGDLAVIGERYYWESGGPVHVFDITTGEEIHQFTSSDMTEYENFGNTVAVDNGRVIVGAYNDDLGAGAVFIFDARPQLAITPTPLHSRQAVEFTACGLKPNKKTWLLYTYKGLEPHLVKRLNITVDLLRPRKLRKRKSDSAGNVTWQLRAPRAKFTRNIWFQVAQKGRVSNYIATQIIP